jgi:hypothetical protein
MVNRNRHLWNASLVILIFSGIIVAVSTTIADPDLWGHILWGEDLLRDGQFQQTESYSYLTKGQRWIDHAWLSDVLIAQTWQRLGPSGLLLVKIIAWTTTLGLIFVHLARNGALTLRAGLLLFLGMPLLAPSWPTVRPQMFTALLYTITLLIIWQAENGRYRWLWVLPPLFLIWANIHGSFLAILGLVGLWGMVHLLTQRNSKTWRKTLPPLLLTAVMPLINPYGFELYRFLIEQLGIARPEITEWRAMQLFSLLGAIYLGWVILIILGVNFSQKLKSPALIVLLVASAALPWMAVRHLMLFGLTALVIGGPFIADAWNRYMPAKAAPSRLPIWAITLPALAGIVLMLMKPPNVSTIPFSKRLTYPVDAVALLKESGVSGNLAVFFNWGNYAAWHLRPKIKISVDTRERFAYDEAAYQANIRFFYGNRNWADLIEDYPTNLALIPNGSPADNLLELHPAWELIFQDEVSALYAVRDHPEIHRLTNAANSRQPVLDPRVFP